MTYADPNDLDTDLDLEDDEETDTPQIRKIRQSNRQLKKEMRDLRQAADAGKEATRRLALLDAKLPETPQVKFFLDHYDGDLTAEAIRSAAASYGFIEPDAAVNAEVKGIDQMSQAAAGAQAAPSPDEDAQLQAELAAIPRGPNGPARVEAVMRKYNRIPDDE